MKNLLFILVAFPLFLCAQTGPGGVGTADGSGNLSLWLDAERIYGISNGNNLSTWLDRSGNGYNASIGSNAPSYSENGGGNNLPTVTFDASNQEYMRIPPNAEIMPTNEVSAFFVGNMKSGSDNWASIIATFDDNAGNDGWAFERQNGANNMMFWVDSYTGNTCATTYTNGVNEVWTLIFNTSSNRGYGYKSEAGCSFPFNGPMGYNGGANDDFLLGVGPDNSGPNYYAEGDISELVVYDVALNDAQRIIVSNYLSAKYDLPLSANDVYLQDDNGDFDFDVAGIGRVDASNIHSAAQGGGILRILNPTHLGDNEFLMWGHDRGSQAAHEEVDVPGAVQARLSRVWRFSEANSAGSSVDVGAVDLQFDLSGMGSVTASDLRLIIDVSKDGLFANETEIAGATAVGGNVYQFAGVTGITDSVRLTLGTISTSQTVLPVELVSFNAFVINEDEVELNWLTSKESNLASFNIEKSKEGKKWQLLSSIPADGVAKNYLAIDKHPFEAYSYYRLKQIDNNGSFTYSDQVQVKLNESLAFKAYPNPFDNRITIEGTEAQLSAMKLFNIIGADVSSDMLVAESFEGSRVLNLTQLPSGIYLLKAAGHTTKILKN